MASSFSLEQTAKMINKEEIKAIAEQHIQDPFFLVEASVNPGNVIIIEIDSDETISIDDCINLSKAIESQLDRDVEDFELEVGSAGITSPFKMPRQYKKNIGNEVEVLSKTGQKLSGVLKNATESDFAITITKKVKQEGAKKKTEIEEDVVFKYDEVKYTKYLIRFK